MNRINAANRALFEELVKQVQVQGNAAGIAVAIVDEEERPSMNSTSGTGIRSRSCLWMKIRSSVWHL